MLRRVVRRIRAILTPPAPLDLAPLEERIRDLEDRLPGRIEAEVQRRVDSLVAARLQEQMGDQFEAMLRLTTEAGHPNINPVWRALKDLEAARLDIKLLGYQMGLAHEHRLQAIPLEAPGPFLADCKPVTQDDMETRWFRYWCEQLRERPRYHRKLWEFAYIMQGLHAAGALKPEARVLILGAGYQPAPSYLAAKGAEVVIAQHGDEAMPGAGGDPLFNADLVDKAIFEKRVSRRQVDLSALPEDLTQFDASVSIGAAAHRGSIAAGLNFLSASVAVLKPGGVAIHVADFNYADDAQTLDDWGLVLFQRRHFEALVEGWRTQGHETTPLDFHVGHQAMDRFVDIPPFDVNQTEAQDRLWRDGWQAAHLKTTIDGFAVTSFGMVVRRSRG
jgi:hypothetical protein